MKRRNFTLLGGTTAWPIVGKDDPTGTRPRITKQSRCFRKSSGNESQPDRLVGKVLARARQRAGFGFDAGKPLDHDFPHDFTRGHGQLLWAKPAPGGDWIARWALRLRKGKRSNVAEWAAKLSVLDI
jgi:hypothetical protein